MLLGNEATAATRAVCLVGLDPSLGEATWVSDDSLAPLSGSTDLSSGVTDSLNSGFCDPKRAIARVTRGVDV